MENIFDNFEEPMDLKSLNKNNKLMVTNLVENEQFYDHNNKTNLRKKRALI